MVYLSVLLAAVASWIAGVVWYRFLGRSRLAALGRADLLEASGRPPLTALALAFAAELVMAAMLRGILVHIGDITVRRGVISGGFIWFGFVITTMAVNHAYAREKPTLTAIDGGHWLVVLLIQGAVLGQFGL